MKKILTELHLMMEREDLQFVASEIVKYYNMSSRVKMKRGRYKDEKGFYHYKKVKRKDAIFRMIEKLNFCKIYLRKMILY